MKKNFIFVLSCILLLTVVNGCNNSDSSTAKEIEIKLAIVGNENSQYGIAAKLFQAEVEEKSNSQIKVNLFPNGSLGGEREIIEGVKFGTIQMSIATTDGALPAWIPETQVLSIPYLFANKEEAYFILDNTLQTEFEPLFEAQGLIHLGFAELGFRHFTNNVKEVKSASDMQGLSIRVQEAPIWFSLINALGATATPVPFNELYTALSQGMVDGQENPIASVSSARFNEVQKYMVLDGHTYAAGSIIINKDFMENLPEDLQKVISDAAVTTYVEQRIILAKQEASDLEYLKEAGMIITEPDLDTFVNATEGLYKQEEITKLVDPALVELIKENLK